MNNHLPEIAKHIRHNIVTMTTRAGTGHPSSSLSAVELMTSLWFGGFYQYDPKNPDNLFNDRLIFSKGHASPLLYALYHCAGWIEYKELMSLRRFNSRLEGHATPLIPWVDVATGSLGQGLSIGVGMALGIKSRFKNQNLNMANVYVLMGDSEFSEGQIYEALQLASYYKLNNLIGILDVNRLGQRGETMLGWNIDKYEERIKSFGWNTIVVENGNDINLVNNAYTEVLNYSRRETQPSMIIAKTVKGKGIHLLENTDGWHGKPIPEDMLHLTLKDLGKVDLSLKGKVNAPKNLCRLNGYEDKKLSKMYVSGFLDYKKDEKIATREAYGKALKIIAKDPSLIVLDAETSNSTYANTICDVAPDKFYEMFIAEQNMISVALGLSKLGFAPFASSFAAFLTRAYDQIRMAQYSIDTKKTSINIVGSHAGVSIGADGSSQMALEDISMMRSILNSIVLYPSDAVSTIKIVTDLKNNKGIAYLRLTREKTPILYKNNESFPIGGSKVFKNSSNNIAAVVGAGITLHEALKAQSELAKKNIHIVVIDAYSVKPIDKKSILKFANETGHLIVVEDHYPYGGLGEAVKQSFEMDDNIGGKVRFKFSHLAVYKIPRSGAPSELLKYEKIDSDAIIQTVLQSL